jgi:signal transduction histidine kinase
MKVIAAPLRVIVDPVAWSSLLFLGSRMPLGLLYFLLPAGIGAAGVLLVPVAGIGVAVLVVALMVAWALAAFERQLGRWWLRVEVRAASSDGPTPGSWWARLRAFVSDSVTWKSLAYLLLQLPLGVVVFPLFAGAAALALAFMASPLAYLLLVVVPRPADLDLVAFLQRLGIAFAGAIIAILVLHLAGPAGRGYGLLIQLLLGMGRADVELARARREAASEHARAEDLEQKRTDLIMSMSHELRTPAASIQGHAEALLNPDEHLSEAERRRFLEVLAREAARVGALTDDLLSIARTDAGGVQLDLGTVDLLELVDHVHDAMTPIARRDREITLTKAVDPQVPAAWADRDRLSQVLMNLVRNAITYTPDGGIVSIRLSTGDGDRVALTVEDTGVGIEQADLDRIFDRFYRTDASRSRLTGGFGLGLAISRELVDAMDGEIRAESEPGSGSRFTVLLKRAG